MRRSFVALLLLVSFGGPGFAGDHVVPAADLEGELADRSAARARDLAELEALIQRDEVAERIASAGFEPAQVRAAAPLLDDATLADLAARARALDADVEGGILGKLILLLLVAILLVVLLNQLD